MKVTIDRIRGALQRKPGKRFSESEQSGSPKAAVCMILRLDKAKDQIDVLLLQRRVFESDPWSGQMAFPGGRYQENDGDIKKTAVREAMEECGVDISRCELLGRLDDIAPGNRSIAVTPFVVLAPESVTVKIDGIEIIDYVWIPMNFFAEAKNSSPMQFERSGTKYEVPSFKYRDSYVVWGMTLRIVNDLLNRIL